VWSRLGLAPTPRRASVVALVAAIVVGGWAGGMLALRHGRPAAARIEARVEGPLRPDGSTAPGRTWHVAFDGAELRLYRNGLRWGERCPGAPACAAGARQELRLALEGPGDYRAVAFSATPGDEGGSLHEDTAQATARGVSFALSEPLIVY
jgi:hypothetical protein